MKNITVEERLNKGSVKLSCGCQIWIEGENGVGYGQLNWKNRILRVHRLSYQTFIGSPDGWQVLHLCHNKLCIAPSHLYLGTAEDNATDASLNGDLRKRCGANIKLTIEEVLEIRKLLEEGAFSRQYLAKFFSISEPTLSEIANRKTWRDI